jgi:hypothetical protein
LSALKRVDEQMGASIRPTFVLLLTAAAIGCTIGGLMLFIAFDHNPQGAFIDTETGSVDTIYAAELFASWAVPSMISFFLVGSLLRWLFRISRP